MIPKQKLFLLIDEIFLLLFSIYLFFYYPTLYGPLSSDSALHLSSSENQIPDDVVYDSFVHP